MQRKKAYIPPCPDPELYVLVKSKEGNFWRRKRGSFKKAVLNSAFSTNAEMTKLTGPAASAIVQQLKPYLVGLNPGRLTLRISNGLRKALKENNRID